MVCNTEAVRAQSISPEGGNLDPACVKVPQILGVAFSTLDTDALSQCPHQRTDGLRQVPCHSARSGLSYGLIFQCTVALGETRDTFQALAASCIYQVMSTKVWQVSGFKDLGGTLGLLQLYSPSSGTLFCSSS